MAGNKCFAHVTSYRQADQYSTLNYVFQHLNRGLRQKKSMAFPSGHAATGLRCNLIDII
jgi:hypothetical protein